jgi:hypothetical protein
MRWAAFLLALVSSPLAGCAYLQGEACPPGSSVRPTAELVFGRNVGHSEGVSEADWAGFLDEEVTPRFPDGLSVFEAQGQWRGPSAALVRERSKALFLILAGPEDEAKIAAIREAYKARFKQDSVLMIRRQDCIGF